MAAAADMAGSPVIAAAKVSAVVMVQATPEAEAICQKNQLSAVDLLRPFGNVEKAFDVTTVGEQYRLRKFAMRFVHTNEFKECEQQNADLHLTRLAVTRLAARAQRCGSLCGATASTSPSKTWPSRRCARVGRLCVPRTHGK